MSRRGNLNNPVLKARNMDTLDARRLQFRPAVVRCHKSFRLPDAMIDGPDAGVNDAIDARHQAAEAPHTRLHRGVDDRGGREDGAEVAVGAAVGDGEFGQAALLRVCVAGQLEGEAGGEDVAVGCIDEEGADAEVGGAGGGLLCQRDGGLDALAVEVELMVGHTGWCDGRGHADRQQ